MTRWIITMCATAVLGGCVTAPRFDECQNPAVTPVNIKWQVQNKLVRLQTSPNLAMVDPGDTIRFHVGGNPAETATVEGKDADSQWINGTSSGGYFFVCVPPDAPRDKRYFYKVTVSNIGFLDPEVRVKR